MKCQITLIAALLCSMYVSAQNEPLRRMAVMSDIHIMAPQLLVKEGKAFDDYIGNDRKLLVQGPELLDSAMAHTYAYRPQVLLITGDLTKDGERVSHEYLVNYYLKPASDKGIRIFVIPGNHDVNNPHARVFYGDSVKQTTTVSPSDFATIYHDYGYRQALARDSHSLSYAIQLDPITRLIAVDACKYEENDFKRDICVTGGRIKPETMQFIKQQAEDAKHKGMKVLMMMHHGLVEHWKWQHRVMGDYLVDNYKRESKRIADMGVKVVFTGHFHSQDATSRYGITDIETGSTVSYPHPYRFIDINPSAGTMSISTNLIETLGSMEGAPETLKQKSERFANSALASVIEHMVSKKVPESVKKKCGRVLGEAYAIHLAGDEKPSDDFCQQLKSACKDLRRYSWKWAFIMSKVGRYLTTDQGTPDNDLDIVY